MPWGAMSPVDWKQGIHSPNHVAQPHQVPKQQSPVTLNCLLWSCELEEIVPSLKLLSSGILSQPHIVTSFVIHDKMYNVYNPVFLIMYPDICKYRESTRKLSWHLRDGIVRTQSTFPPCTSHHADISVQSPSQHDPANNCSEVGVGIVCTVLFWAFNAYFKCFPIKMQKWAFTCLFFLLNFLNKRFPHIHS